MVIEWAEISLIYWREKVSEYDPVRIFSILLIGDNCKWQFGVLQTPNWKSSFWLMLKTISICDTCPMSASCSRLSSSFTLYRCTLSLYFF